VTVGLLLDSAGAQHPRRLARCMCDCQQDTDACVCSTGTCSPAAGKGGVDRSCDLGGGRRSRCVQKCIFPDWVMVRY
jgi:hypothetical protein